MLREIALVAVFAGAGPALGQSLITSAANVRLRSAAATDAEVVAMLPLGTELAMTGTSSAEGWIPVRTAGDDSRQGWIDQSLVVPVSNTTYPAVITNLIAARLARQGDGRGARRELLDLIEAVLQRPWSREEAAHLSLQRLRALDALVRSIPFNRSLWSDELRSWVQERTAEIRYNEPGGHWMLRRETILAAHDANRGTSAADEIAWYAAVNNLGGECEGHLVCYLDRINLLEGEYLRREPGGRHVQAAAADILSAAARLIEGDPGMIPAQYYFNAQNDCTSLRSGTSALESAVLASQAPQRAEVAAKLRELASRCD